jgi:hypothetical protein
MNMNLLFLLLLISGISHAQLYENYKEYRFVNDYNMALTVYKNPGASQKPGVPGIADKPASVNNFDSVYLQPLNYADNKQVWLVEFKPGLCNTTGYYTIRNKATGEYLSVLGYEETITTATMKQTGYRLVMTPLKRKGPDDIISNQKWRFANLEDIFNQNGYYRSAYPAIFKGRTEMVSLKNFVYPELCQVSTFSFDITYKHLSNNVGIQTQLLSGGYPISYDNSRFRIIPNIPVSFVTLKNIGIFRCPKVLLRGDREFGGRISMDLKIELELNAQRNAIYLVVKFRAEEPKGDYTTTELSWSEKVYDAPAGIKIKSIVSYPVWHNNFGYSLNEESFNQMPSEFLRFCEVVGDTMGDDVSTDDNCNDDTRIGNFIFNKVAVIFE